jgi:hypothetical protein
MRRYLLITLGVILAKGVTGQSTLDLVQQASRASGTNYIDLRNRVVAQGDAAVPQLQTILNAIEKPWAERVMAGICLDRIQKGAVIQEILQKDWRNDPAVKDLPGWKTRLGLPRELGALIVNQIKDANVPYYCLELVWKQTGEHNPVTPRTWAPLGAKIAFDEKNPFLADILVERLRADMDINRVEIDDYYMKLIEIGRNQDLPLLFDAWLQSFGKAMEVYPEAYEKFHKQFPNIAYPYPGGGLDKLLALATPADADWIAKKLKDVPLSKSDRAVVDAYLRRCGRLPSQTEVPPSKPVETPNIKNTSTPTATVSSPAAKTEAVKPVETVPSTPVTLPPSRAAKQTELTRWPLLVGISAFTLVAVVAVAVLRGRGKRKSEQ